MDRHDRVCGCLRYREYSNEASFSELSMSGSALAKSTLGWALEAAVYAERLLAIKLRVPFVESGGWALAEEIRGTTEALRMALAMYGLSQALGGAIGISTATQRHSSASRFSGALAAGPPRTLRRASRCQPMTILNTAARWRRCDFIPWIPIRASVSGLRKSKLGCARFRS